MVAHIYFLFTMVLSSIQKKRYVYGAIVACLLIAILVIATVCILTYAHHAIIAGQPNHDPWPCTNCTAVHLAHGKKYE